MKGVETISTFILTTASFGSLHHVVYCLSICLLSGDRPPISIQELDENQRNDSIFLSSFSEIRIFTDFAFHTEIALTVKYGDLLACVVLER